MVFYDAKERYVSHAILQNRKTEAGGIARVPARCLKGAVRTGLCRHSNQSLLCRNGAQRVHHISNAEVASAPRMAAGIDEFICAHRDALAILQEAMAKAGQEQPS